MKNIPMKDEFLSEEDLSLSDMSEEELEAYWNFWLELAQITTEEDKEFYSYGVFVQYPVAKSSR